MNNFKKFKIVVTRTIGFYLPLLSFADGFPICESDKQGKQNDHIKSGIAES